ncbi:sensor histidine kinase [Pedobacter hartonius]|uniref:histidine kinase n=1 Tax=Pedobacter hartonius TaxID=425514 RepID=A0A1H4HBR9_9SPHI|nr:ATP-binding protein [Pedobacter hartonius]SEB18562.1 PAS domain S-box-containing protein [Pedobacter hartonius]
MELFSDPFFRVLFDTAVPRVVLQADIPDFTIIAYNRAYEMATHNKDRDITGMSLWEAYNPEKADGEGARILPEALTRAVNNQESIYLPPFKYNIPSALPGEIELSWWEVEITYVAATETRPAFLLTTTYNITERILNRERIDEGLKREQQMDEELRSINEELSAANDEFSAANDELTSTVHELNILNEQMGMMNEQLMHSQLELKSLSIELEKRVERRTYSLAESEQQFRQLADSIIQMIWITDEHGNPEYFNQRWLDFVGDLLGTTIKDYWEGVFHPEDMERVREIWSRCLETGDDYELEYRLKNCSGEYVWVLGRASPFLNTEGKIIKWFGTCTDINELKQLEEKKDDFISIASHELKTPVTSLKASLQLLNKLKDNDSAKHVIPPLIEQACRSSERVSILIEDLLNMSRLNKDQLHLNKSRFLLAKLTEECCSHVRLAGIYSITTSGDVELEVNADAARIDQVVVNFVNNAVKYAASSKEIRVLIEKMENVAKVSVIDQGPGIPVEKLPHLFERYYRAGGDGVQYSGLGLGLYISAEIIRKHGGQIGVNSEPGKGSTFWFTLPLQNFVE